MLYSKKKKNKLNMKKNSKNQKKIYLILKAFLKKNKKMNHFIFGNL